MESAGHSPRLPKPSENNQKPETRNPETMKIETTTPEDRDARDHPVVSVWLDSIARQIRKEEQDARDCTQRLIAEDFENAGYSKAAAARKAATVAENWKAADGGKRAPLNLAHSEA